MNQSIAKVPELVRKLYEVVAEFKGLFPDRSFTPDGHLVGSIGEVIAAYRYNLTLHPASEKTHDATALDKRQVQIKTTQGSSVALRHDPEHLIVLRLDKTGGATEVFNGPGGLVWARCGAMQSNGQRTISLPKLRALKEQVPLSQQLPSR